VRIYRGNQRSRDADADKLHQFAVAEPRSPPAPPPVFIAVVRRPNASPPPPPPPSGGSALGPGAAGV